MPLAELPQTNKQHAVPQNIMEVEFKLIGDLTMRQFAYLMLFGGIAYLFSVTVIGIFKWPLVVISAILAFGLAFVPIQDRGLDEWIVNFIRAVYGPTQRIWKKEPQIPSAFVYESIAVVKQEMIALAPTSSRRKLEEYLQYQFKDATVDPLDIPEAEYIRKVHSAYANMAPQMPAAPSTGSVGVSVIEPEETGFPEQYIPAQEQMPAPSEGPQEPQQTQQPQEQQGAQPYSAPSITQDISQQAQAPAQMPTTPPEQPKQAPSVIVKGRKPAAPAPAYETIAKPAQFTAMSITPDMHAGRRFTNLLPNSGEIILPIRGEKVLKTADDANIEQDISDKAEKLKALLAQIKATSNVTPPAPVPAPVVQEAPAAPLPDATVSNEAEDLAAKLKLENDTLEQEIDKLKSETDAEQGAQMSDKETKIKELEMQKQRTQEAYVKLEQQVLDLQNKLQEKQVNEGVPLTSSKVAPIYAKIQPLTTSPNVVTGIVKKADGSVAEGLVLMIKGDKGDIVRAFKTNSLGQFSLITPLNSGIYTLEVSKDEKSTGMTFDIISLEAKGEVIPPLEIVGKPLQ